MASYPAPTENVSIFNAIYYQLPFNSISTADAYNTFLKKSGDSATGLINFSMGLTSSGVITSLSTANNAINTQGGIDAALGFFQSGVAVDVSAITGVSDGTAAANKALILDANKDISGIDFISVDHISITSPNDPTHDPVAFACAGGLDVQGNSSFHSQITITNGINGTLLTAAQPNITSVGTLTSITTSGNLTMSGITISSSEIGVLDAVVSGTAAASKALVLDASKNISTINSLTATSITGTLQTAAQGNITSVGTLTSLTLSGGISGATTISASGLITFTNTTISTSASTGGLVLSGGMGIAKNITIGGTAVSAASWTTSGIQYNSLATTYTNSSTASSGTAASATITSFAQPTIAATNTTVTTTNAATVYIANAPTAGTNMTLTNAYSLWIPNGKVLFDAAINSTSLTTGSLVVSGGMSVGNNFYTSYVNSVTGVSINSTSANQSAWQTVQGNSTSFVDGSFSICHDWYGTGGVRGSLQAHNSTSGTSTNSVFVGSITDNDLRLGTNDSTRVTITAGTNPGRVGIGTSGPSFTLDISGSVSTTIAAGGTLYGQGNNTAYTSTLGPLTGQSISLRTSNGILITAGSIFVTSDMRLKKDIEYLDDLYADRVLKLDPIKYRMKSDPDNCMKQLGLSAQQCLKLGLSSIVNITDREDLDIVDDDVDLKDIAFSVDYSKLSVLLLLTIKKISKELSELKNKIDNL